jgi:hypothetical protein
MRRVWHADADGSLQLYHKVDGWIDVAVRHGQWEAWCTQEAKVFVRMLELSGRSVALERVPFAPPFDRSLDLKGAWIDDHVVRVVDQETGEPLTGIELVKQPHWNGYARHPGIQRPELVVAKGLESPLQFAAYGHLNAIGRCRRRLRVNVKRISRPRQS